jgi:hypothetical protein
MGPNKGLTPPKLFVSCQFGRVVKAVVLSFLGIAYHTIIERFTGSNPVAGNNNIFFSRCFFFFAIIEESTTERLLLYISFCFY